MPVIRYPVRLNKKPVIADLPLAGVVPLRSDVFHYEQEKQAWIASHLGATPEQYTAAMIEIAKRCGV